jgi:7-cyano-7-deazaguanine synthase
LDYGQPHVKELEYARSVCRALRIDYTEKKIPSMGGLEDGNWIVPFRNGVLISHAISMAAQAEADSVTIGCNAGDAREFPDCRPGFIATMNAAAKASEYNIEVCAPFIETSKWQIAAMAREMGISPSETWSCYRGGTTPCGNCPACVKMQEATEHKEPAS